MPTEEIASLEVPAAKDAVLFLWSTCGVLPQALAVMSAWGFEYRAHIVWVKPSPGIGTGAGGAYLDWRRPRLYKLTARGEIPHYKHEGRLLFRRDELDAWLARYVEGSRE